MLPNELIKYGHRRYRSIDGKRHLVGLRPTIRPLLNDSNEHFQQRMARMEQILLAMPDVREVELSFRWSDEAIVECLVDVVLVPTLDPIDEDPRPAGGRTDPRGRRGGGGMKLCSA